MTRKLINFFSGISEILINNLRALLDFLKPVFVVMMIPFVIGLIYDCSKKGIFLGIVDCFSPQSLFDYFSSFFDFVVYVLGKFKEVF